MRTSHFDISRLCQLMRECGRSGELQFGEELAAVWEVGICFEEQINRIGMSCAVRVLGPAGPHIISRIGYSGVKQGFSLRAALQEL